MTRFLSSCTWTAKAALMALCTLVAVELYLRCTQVPELLFSTWCTPGIHQPDSRFGYVFTPNYRGTTWHVDGVMGVPLTLDRYGFRPRVVNSTHGSTPRTVAIVGGRSMMFSYGLTGGETVAGQVAAFSKHELDVYSASWAGFGLYRTWHAYRAEPARDRHPEVLLFTIYAHPPAMYSRLPSDFTRLPTPLPREYLFRYMSDLVLKPSNPLVQKLGRHAYTSYFGYCILERIAPLMTKIERHNTRLPDNKAPVTESPPHRAGPSRAEEGADWFSRFLQYADGILSEEGTTLALVFLPRSHPQRRLFDELSSAVPPGIRVIDLHRELYRNIQRADWMAGSHYGPRCAAMLGEALASIVDDILAEKDAEAGPATERPDP